LLRRPVLSGFCLALAPERYPHPKTDPYPDRPSNGSIRISRFAIWLLLLHEYATTIIVQKKCKYPNILCSAVKESLNAFITYFELIRVKKGVRVWEW
jgi:hypothetical protein